MALVPLSYNVRSLFVRKATTIATALGIALVGVCITAGAVLAYLLKLGTGPGDSSTAK